MGELRLPWCVPCGAPFFYPRRTCPDCGSAEIEWRAASGRATLQSYIINHRPIPAGDPLIIAIVKLEEGPRMMTNIVNVEPVPEDLTLDMALEVAFVDRDGQSLAVFGPVGSW
nr:OB-fold domain-containing protein [Cumulibacter soli]